MRIKNNNNNDSNPWAGVLLQVAITEYPRLGGLNNKHGLIPVLKSSKLKIKVLADPGLVRALFQARRRPSSRCVLT